MIVLILALICLSLYLCWPLRSTDGARRLNAREPGTEVRR